MLNDMKAYSFKYNKKTNLFGFTDSGRHWISFKSNELKEVADFILRKDISIRAIFKDDKLKERKLKVSLGKTRIWSMESGVMKPYNVIDTQSYPSYKRVAIEFPLVNGNSLFVWYDKGLVFYGKDRLSAVMINRYDVKFEFTYLK